VIASLTGATLALFVVEPTPTGIHDFIRVAQLARQLTVPGILVINKADLSESGALELEQIASNHGVELVGRIPYDPAVVHAQIERKTVVEASNGSAAQAIRAVWRVVQDRLVNTRATPRGEGEVVTLLKS